MKTRGDERLSAEGARDRYTAAGGDSAIADLVYSGVMATAFNPNTSKQNVVYPEDQEVSDGQRSSLLVQELVAAADLLGPTGSRGPLGALEYCVEQLCLEQKGRLTQERLGSQGTEINTLSSIEDMLGQIDSDPVLKAAFIETASGQAKFFTDFLKYSGVAIKSTCGKGIDDLFPGRRQNATLLERFYLALQQGQSVSTVWQQAKDMSGDKEPTL